MVDQFRGQYACLSNFAPVIENITVEHWYQANRTNDKEWQDRVMSANTAKDAKRLGNEIRKLGLDRPDWHSVNWHVMYQFVFLKMILRPDYRLVLLNTGEEELVEGNWWHDNYWGRCICEKCKTKEKLNNLGLIHVIWRNYFRTCRVIPDLTPYMKRG